LTEAVRSYTTYTPDFQCSGKRIHAIQYYLHSSGPVQGGAFLEANPSRQGKCDDDGLKWLPKTVTDTTGTDEDEVIERRGKRGRHGFRRYGGWKERRENGFEIEGDGPRSQL
jgi:hypothetical protein